MKANGMLRWWHAAALLVIAIVYLAFALQKSHLGIDFTDEGMFMAAPLRLAQGERAFSSEILTLIRPFELVTQYIYYALPSVNLYSFRLSGWLIHIISYLLLTVLLYKETRSLSAAPIASIAFFTSYAWPSTIATPNYRSISTDMLLCFMIGYYWSRNWPNRYKVCIRIASGVALFIAVVCYPALFVVYLMVCLTDLWTVATAPNRGKLVALFEVSEVLVGALCGFILIGVLWAQGSMFDWLARTELLGGSALNSLKQHGLMFYWHLLSDLLTKSEPMRDYTIVSCVIVSSIVALRYSILRVILPTAECVFYVGSLIFLSWQYHGSIYTDHFFYPTTYCLISLTALGLYCLDAFGTGSSTIGKKCLLFSIGAFFVYSTATYFFDYYYSINSGLLGLPFAFTFLYSRGVWSVARMPYLLRTTSLTVALASAIIAGAYNYLGVRRDASIEELTASFSITPLKGIQSNPERVAAIEQVCEYLHAPFKTPRDILIFDDAPMLYYILNAHPAYGMAWPVRYNIPIETHKYLINEMMAKKLPEYAIRVLIDPSEPDWRQAKRLHYGEDHLLNRVLMANYSLIKVIYPFEIYRIHPGH